MDKPIWAFKEITEQMLPLCGGKGAALVRLSRMGLPVPEGWIIPAGADTEAALSALRKALPKTGTWAVRSSALNEDGEKASFAGAYETVTDVPLQGLEAAARRVLASGESSRVEGYANALSAEEGGIALVVQQYVPPDYAGVVFTADPLSGSGAVMVGSFVRGAGEALVSGTADGTEFRMDAMDHAYTGPAEFAPWAKQLFRYCRRIRDSWSCPMDVEWAVSGGRLWLLQARPITTLRRIDRDSYTVNGSLAGEYLLTRTNVGEIFMRPLSPVTFSVLESICEKLGLPCFIDNVCGQAYMNLSVVCSVMVALGVPRKTAFSKIGDIAGALPDGVEVPCFPVRKSAFLRRILVLLKPKRKKKGYGLSAAGRIIRSIHNIDEPAALRRFWDEEFIPFMNASLGEIAKGANVLPLFRTRTKLIEMCEPALAERLLVGAGGVLDSMKPLLLLQEAAEGKITVEEYAAACGHRHADEMELSCPYPYEDPDFPQNRIREHRAAGVDVRAMLEAQRQDFESAKEEFLSRYPRKKAWLERKLKKYGKACAARERVRSDGVKIFCALREYLLKAGEITELDEDIFLLYLDEALELLDGEEYVLANIPARRESMKKYLDYPLFPNLILGRFVPEEWLADPERRQDFCGPAEAKCGADSIRGFPGAAGRVTGRVRVLRDVSEIDGLQKGEVLVTTATNVGWTLAFPRAAAVVTDIGAPLSHAAIVAREFGIPAVVGCGSATTLLKTGDWVTVDGALGQVARAEPPEMD